ncbi:hypothetical protein AB1Y20_020366 [Prymnesium parvum]|uniref:Dolichol phosphate-mannose biosynthesis regulatory protein n=1 Tax=Prymnesium parvum TaxID=97485 RepID=A0AB34JUF6_PRYPA
MKPLASVGLVAFTLSLTLLVYWLLFSKLLPRTGHHVLDWLRDDTYYCVLVPLTLPVAVVAAYLRWFTNQLFCRN